VTAGEDQPQFVILDVLGHGRLRCRVSQRCQFGQETRKPRPPAPAIDRLEPAGGDQPGIRIGRDALVWPLLGRGSEGLVEGLFCCIEAPPSRRISVASTRRASVR